MTAGLSQEEVDKIKELIALAPPRNEKQGMAQKTGMLMKQQVGTKQAAIIASPALIALATFWFNTLSALPARQTEASEKIKILEVQRDHTELTLKEIKDTQREQAQDIKEIKSLLIRMAPRNRRIDGDDQGR